MTTKRPPLLHILLMLFVMKAAHAVYATDSNTYQPITAEIAAPYADVEYELNMISGINATINPHNGDIYLYRDGLVRISIEGAIDTLASPLFDAGGTFEIDTHPEGDRVRLWDRGVGRVFDFYLDENTLVRKDRSHNHSNMFGHAAYVDREGGIYAMGGYGYWQLKNLLIRYNPIVRGWEKVHARNRDRVPEGQDGKLFSDNNYIYYIVEDLHRSRIRHELFSFNKEQQSWGRDRTGSYLLRSTFRNKFTTFRFNMTYSMDRENRITAFISETDRNSTIVFYDMARQKRYDLNTEQFDMHEPRAVFYSELLNEWVVLSHGPRREDRTRLNIRTIDFDTVTEAAVPVTAPFWIERPLFYSSASVAALLLLLLAAYFMRINGKKWFKENQNRTGNGDELKSITIIYQNNEPVHVHISGRSVNLSTDDTVCSFWSLILNLALVQTDQISITDFDRYVFDSHAEASHRSRARNKLIELVNNKVEKPFIRTVKNEYDKRIKMLKIDLTQLTVSNLDKENRIRNF